MKTLTTDSRNFTKSFKKKLRKMASVSANVAKKKDTDRLRAEPRFCNNKKVHPFLLARPCHVNLSAPKKQQEKL